MKHILTIILFFATLTVAAQEYSPCYTNNMAKGNTAFNQGRYSEARTYYVTAKQCAGGNPSAAQQKINSCDAKIKAQKEAKASEAKRRAEEEAMKKPQEFTVNSVTFKMIYVQGGTFTMGCTLEQGNDCTDRERPSHSVTLSDFYIGETEVTQALWQAVMGTSIRDQRNKKELPQWITSKFGINASFGEGMGYPIYFVNYNEAVEFCNRLNNLLRDILPSGLRFSLPTEAQWEYAARGGSKCQGYKYSGSNFLDDVAWIENNSGSKAHPVKTKLPNELGLYDMSGNVREWCQDWYSPDYYSVSVSTNPQGPTSGPGHVLRGGCWNSFGSISECRVSYRGYNLDDSHSVWDGFRLALVR